MGSKYIAHLTLRLTQTMEKQTTTGLPCWAQAALGAPGWQNGPIQTQLQRPHQSGMLLLYSWTPIHPSLPHACLPWSLLTRLSCKKCSCLTKCSQITVETTRQQVPLFPSVVQTTASYWQKCKCCWALVVCESMNSVNSVYNEVPSGPSKGLKRSSFVCHLKDKIKEEKIF